MNKNISSEEKLLSLIRRKKQKSSTISKNVDKTDTAMEWGVISLLFWQWGAVFFLAGAACLLIFLLAKYQITKSAEAPLFDVATPAAVRNVEDNFLQEIRQMTSPNYRDIIQSRDIFAYTVEQKKDVASVATSQKPVISERYKLVGIMLDNNPTVIIEDLQSHQTLILSKGQKVDDMILEDIKLDRAIFKEGDRIMELVR